MRSGKVRDVNTGAYMGRVRDMATFFQQQMQEMVRREVDFYVVYGRCQHLDVRNMITFFQTMNPNILTICDKKMDSDTVWLFEGEPEELGYDQRR